MSHDLVCGCRQARIFWGSLTFDQKIWHTCSRWWIDPCKCYDLQTEISSVGYIRLRRYSYKKGQTSLDQRTTFISYLQQSLVNPRTESNTTSRTHRMQGITPRGGPNLYNILCFVMLCMNQRAVIDIIVLPKALHGTPRSELSVPNIDNSSMSYFYFWKIGLWSNNFCSG